MEMVYRLDGKEVSRSHRELSTDGRTLKVISTDSRIDGSTSTKTFTYQRTSGSTGFAGGWTELDQSARRPSVFVIYMSGQVLHLSFPGKKQHADIPLTGVEAPIQGLAPNVHASLSAKTQGPRELLVEQKFDGVAVRETSMTLTQDGSTLIQKTWRPEHPSLKEMLVYQRQ